MKHQAAAPRRLKLPPFQLTRPSLFQPSWPWLESRSFDHRRSGVILELYRAARVAWVAALMPFHIALCILWAATGVRLPDWLLPGDRHGWNFWQRLSYPFLKRSIWAITDIGDSPDYSTKQEKTYNSLLVFLLHLAFFPDRTLFNVALRVDECELDDKAERTWIVKEAVDPRGLVRPTSVPMFWFEPKRRHNREPINRKRTRSVKPGDRVILYLVGGGYVRGSPTQGNRCFVLAKRTGFTVVGANYRKATRPNKAFPAALQDAITAYKRLVDLGYKDIVLAGDSAGAGLCITLLLYLTTTLRQDRAPSDLVLPTGLLLYSPWSDLTLSSYRQGLPAEAAHDLLNPSMLLNSAMAYLQSASEGSGFADDPSSPYALGPFHPFVSPALPSSYQTLVKLNSAYSADRPLRILMFVGGAEILAPEVRMLAKNFDMLASEERPGVRFEFWDEPGEVHCFPLVPSWVSPAAGRALDKIEEWLLDGVDGRHDGDKKRLN